MGEKTAMAAARKPVARVVRLGYPPPVSRPACPTCGRPRGRLVPPPPPDIGRLLDQLDAELAALRRGLRTGTAGDVDGRLLWCQTIGEIVRLRLEAEDAGAAPGAGPSGFPGSPA